MCAQHGGGGGRGVDYTNCSLGYVLPFTIVNYWYYVILNVIVNHFIQFVSFDLYSLVGLHLLTDSL